MTAAPFLLQLPDPNVEPARALVDGADTYVVVAESSADAKAFVQNYASKVVFSNVTPEAMSGAADMTGWRFRVAVLNSDGSVVTDQTVTNAGQAEAVASASATLTSTANYANGETVTIGSRVYTFKTALTPADGEVLVGATEANSITNLTNAINDSGGTPGTDYYVTAADPLVTAVGAAHTVVVTAKVVGSAANSDAVATTAANASWGAGVTTLSGGVTATNTMAALAGLMVSALNAAGAGITHAAFNNSTHTLTAAGTADNLGDKTLLAEVYPPLSGYQSPVGVTVVPGVPIPGFVGTITDAGLAGAALTVVVAADTYGIPTTAVKARVLD